MSEMRYFITTESGVHVVRGARNVARVTAKLTARGVSYSIEQR